MKRLTVVTHINLAGGVQYRRNEKEKEAKREAALKPDRIGSGQAEELINIP